MSCLRAPALLLLLVSLSIVSRTARTDALDRLLEEIGELDQQAKALGPRYLRGGGLNSSNYVAERLVDGENIYRVKDYQRAAMIFLDIIENYADHAAYPDALFLYADCLFLSGDYVGARAWFREFLEKSHLPGAGRYKEKAILRLIEVAIHQNDFTDMDRFVEMLDQLPSDEARYVRGKYLFFRDDLEGAKAMFQSIQTESEVKLKALYLLGVVLTKQQKYDEAIAVFLEQPKDIPETPAVKDIIDLMNLGAGRLYYEQGQLVQSAEMYEMIAQNSPYFDAALYERASVLIQSGDTTRADQALEVLTITVPESRYLPRAKMLRGNLLLRAGEYDDAERLFDELVAEFTPLMNQLERVIAEQKDTQKFFFDIVERSTTTLDVSTVLPPLVVKWVGEEPEVQRALGLAKNLGAAKVYVKETERLVRLLGAVVEGPSRVNAIPLLREGMRQAQQIQNRLAQLRGKLSYIVEDELGKAIPAVMTLSGERGYLKSRLALLPTTTEEFKSREVKSKDVFTRMRNELSRNAIRLDRLSAMTVAIERFVDDPRYSEGVPQANLQAVVQEVKRHRHVIAKMQTELDELRIDIEQAGYQVGIGDTNDVRDRQLRKRVKGLSRRERGLVQNRGGEDAENIKRAFNTIYGVERRVARFQKELRLEADRRVEEIRQTVNVERERISGYYKELAALGEEAETVVGGVAFENFSSVRRRFHELVLKADVGIIDSAWLRKESHSSRVTDLTSERLKNIRRLDNEFQGVDTETTE